MNYKSIKKGTFLSRPNRFVAHVMIDGTEQIVHVKNTGRCKELLIEGVTVYLEDHVVDMRNRKTRYSLVAVEKLLNNRRRGGTLLINMDSQAPNKAAGEALTHGAVTLPGMIVEKVRAEKTFGSSRFDFFVEGRTDTEFCTFDGAARDKTYAANPTDATAAMEMRAFIEVKGVTLEADGHAKFPDAPTERGVKHILELAEAKRQGYLAYILFVIQMSGIKSFSPNDETHVAFGDALRYAQKEGVHILAYDCRVTPDSMFLQNPVPCVL